MKNLLKKIHDLIWNILDKHRQKKLRHRIMRASGTDRPFTIPLLFGESWKLQKLLDA